MMPRQIIQRKQRLPVCLYASLCLIISCVSAMVVAADMKSAQLKSVIPSLLDSMKEQYNSALTCLDTLATNVDRSKRLAVVYLHAHKRGVDLRISILGCSIQQLLKNVDPSTPLDFFIFSRQRIYEQTKKALQQQLGEDFKRVCLLEIPPEQWKHQKAIVSPFRMRGNKNRFGEYLYMGQWRLLVPYNIITALGYDYFLQVDDDLFVTQPFKTNIVEHMRQNNLMIANHRVYPDKWNIMYGLPEMARFFLMSNNIQPGKTLFQHLNPQNMTGLYSPTKNWSDPDSPRTGYDLRILYGNFLAMSTNLWNKTEVQDWIKLCMASGGLERHRWQEQGVMAWIWLLFTDPEQFWDLSDPSVNMEYLHSRDKELIVPMCGESVREAAASNQGGRAKHARRSRCTTSDCAP